LTYFLCIVLALAPPVLWWNRYRLFLRLLLCHLSWGGTTYRVLSYF